MSPSTSVGLQRFHLNRRRRRTCSSGVMAAAKTTHQHQHLDRRCVAGRVDVGHGCDQSKRRHNDMQA